MFTISKNEQFNSIEVSFDEKPSAAVREALKALRFRWHGVKKVWYGYADIEAVRAALGVCEDETSEAKEAEQPDRTPQDHIRIYYNGIKIDGGEIIRCFYSLDNNKDHAPSVSIHARGYKDLPRDLLPVKNETDLYTDYFDNDHAYITPEHPLYVYFRYAALKARAKDAKRYIASLEKELTGVERWRGRFDVVRRDIETQKRYIAEFEAVTDPKQPSAEDLQKINQQRQQKENEARQAALEEEQRRRENLLNLRVNGRRLISETIAKYPVDMNAPRVLINWSEHPALSEYQDDSLFLSVTAAEIILRTLDEEQNRTRDTAHGIGGYWKTKFTVLGVNIDEQQHESVTAPTNKPEDAYIGRYDLGDGDGGLIAHIRAWGEWSRTHEANGSEKATPDATNETIRFADALKKCVAAEAVGA